MKNVDFGKMRAEEKEREGEAHKKVSIDSEQ
jgi:hypothetical protein